MTFQDYFPIWNKLQTDQQDRIRSNLNFRTVKKGTILHNGDMDCTGLLLVKAGQLRAYILSDEGREITIYRLFDRDLCLFSASCIMLTSTVLGLITMVLFKPRSWCVYCPMGTMTQLICKARNSRT